MIYEGKYVAKVSYIRFIYKICYSLIKDNKEDITCIIFDVFRMLRKYRG